MTIPEAIAILINMNKGRDPYPKERRSEALQLSCEALKFIKENRGMGAGHVPKLLPGETEE